MASNLFKSLFGDDDVAQDEYYDGETSVQQPERRNNVVSIQQAKQEKRLSQIALYEPRLYADVRQIATQLLKGQAVIVNFTQMDDKNAKRVVDFLNGATFAIDGGIKRIGKEIFLCTPKNYEVSGNLSDGMKMDNGNLPN
ncbi:MAG: cell division protein SepF [Lactobacillaceae bacterium]|uniref:cell division protein SepF n=2 Tax=Limosilactobacillus sp. TaxID=2773925 RepID=UPI002A75FB30|nr:cell division protein SepF [Limosilactobacillus sp.]MDD7693280.1 cell division protein SepF [Lactobacillaceae bacterium]MDY2802479.1 cell division protein SepF [Limosilactobacillus sp.]